MEKEAFWYNLNCLSDFPLVVPFQTFYPFSWNSINPQETGSSFECTSMIITLPTYPAVEATWVLRIWSHTISLFLSYEIPIFIKALITIHKYFISWQCFIHAMRMSNSFFFFCLEFMLQYTLIMHFAGPTLKLKRPTVLKKHARLIEGLYEEC